MASPSTKSYIPYILLLILLCSVGLFVGQRIKEGFQSAGTLLQLQTSHVTTAAEAEAQQQWMRRRVRDDLKYLTGSL